MSLWVSNGYCAKVKKSNAARVSAKKVKMPKGSNWTNSLNSALKKNKIVKALPYKGKTNEKGSTWTNNLNLDKSPKRISAKRVVDIRECFVKQNDGKKTMQELVDSCLPKDLADTAPVAQIIAESTDKFKGFYLGLGASLNGDRASYEGRSAHFVNKYGASSHSYGGVIFLGYNFKIGCKSYIGLELQGGMDNLNLKPVDTEGSSVLDTFDINLKKRWRTSFIARFGYLIAPRTSVFVGVGFDLASWKFNSRNISTDQNTAAALNDLNTQKTFHKFGISPRVGFEHNFCDSQIFVRAEYVLFLTQYLKMNQHIERLGAFDGYPSNLYEHKIRPVQHAFIISFGWRF